LTLTILVRTNLQVATVQLEPSWEVGQIRIKDKWLTESVLFANFADFNKFMIEICLSAALDIKVNKLQ
jgi:hypothetical protein